MNTIPWRIVIEMLNVEINRLKGAGTSHVPILHLESISRHIETSLALRFEIEVLNAINQNPETIRDDKYQKDIEKYAEIIKVENDMHRQYTQLVITAGYAGYFGLWAIINNKPDLYIQQSRLLDISLLFVTISVISFVILEIAKVGLSGYGIHLRNKALLKAKAEDDINKKQGIITNSLSTTYLTFWISRIWTVSYPVSVVFGLGGLIILLISLVKNLSVLN